MSTVHNKDLSEEKLTPNKAKQAKITPGKSNNITDKRTENQTLVSSKKEKTSSKPVEYNIEFMCCCKANKSTPAEFLHQFYKNYTIIVIINIVFFLIDIISFSRPPRDYDDDISLVEIIKVLRVTRIVIGIFLIILILWFVNIFISHGKLKKKIFDGADKMIFLSSIMNWIFMIINISIISFACVMILGYAKNLREHRDYDEPDNFDRSKPRYRDDTQSMIYLITAFGLFLGHGWIAWAMIYQSCKSKKAGNAAKCLGSGNEGIGKGEFL